MRVFLGIAAVLIMFISSSCIPIPVPHDQWYSPHFSGSIYDASSGKPLGAVKITLSGYGYAESELGPVVTYSQKDGRFSVVAKRHSNWLPIWLGPAEGVQRGVVRFELNGYVDVKEERSVFTGASSRIKFELTVRMNPQTPNQSLEPTTPAVTIPAAQEVAPAGVVAHL